MGGHRKPVSSLKRTACALLLSASLMLPGACIAPDSGFRPNGESESTTEQMTETSDVWGETTAEGDPDETTGFPNETEDGYTKRY